MKINLKHPENLEWRVVFGNFCYNFYVNFVAEQKQA